MVLLFFYKDVPNPKTSIFSVFIEYQRYIGYYKPPAPVIKIPRMILGTFSFGA